MLDFRTIASGLDRGALEKEKMEYIEKWRDATDQTHLYERPLLIVNLTPMIVMMCACLFLIGLLLKDWHKVGLSVLPGILMVVIACVLERKRNAKRSIAVDTAFAAEKVVIPGIKRVIEYLDFQNYVITCIKSGKPAVAYEGRWLKTREEIIVYMEHEFGFPAECSQLWDGEADLIDFSRYDEHIRRRLKEEKHWVGETDI